MKMNRVFLVLGFVLIMALYSDAQPKAVAPTECCFEFFTGKIPPQYILEVKKTDSQCPQKGFIVTTPKFPRLCVHEVTMELKA
ncbi:C-C motif chemokine 4 homolog [Neoarius graeffei]|uniref:C-C motif chemokine 4 homolog n=1 Tax=Neoarius graeffei TaxID=443677 RepID=UPI00298C3C94|nr:C-C motif chemokine 4 homolog [Neoarius graeffei]XP_060784457.1 C-C motif chemokine 4 homolog [Neoarius graeffei]